MEAPSAEGLPPVGVSRCLLGDAVRYDGGHKGHRYIREVLSAHLRLVPVCPELEAGMGVPREPVRLVVVDPAAPPRILGVRSAEDWTERLDGWADGRLEALAALDLRGFILKQGSPSCGLLRMKTYLQNGMPAGRDGQGLFARRLAEAFPLLPLEEEGRLQDARLRELFLTRVFVYDRWLKLRAAPSPAGLVVFHAAHKILALAHDPAACGALGRLVARAGAGPLAPTLDAYGALLMGCLRRPASRRRNLNAMQHLCGFLKALPASEKQELNQQLMAYRDGVVPHEVPLALLRHHLRQTGHPWALAQHYLAPTPPALGLRATL